MRYTLDPSFAPRELQPSHPPGPLPTLRTFDCPNDEARDIAAQIRRILADTKGILQWRNFAILRKSLLEALITAYRI